jgi:hypothetical protein
MRRDSSVSSSAISKKSQPTATEEARVTTGASSMRNAAFIAASDTSICDSSGSLVVIF